MPIPIIVGIFIGVAALIAAGTVVVVLNWDDIVIAWSGKRVAVLGARGVGKTCLTSFLTTGSIPSEYRQTVAPDKKPPRRFQLGELDLKVKEMLDISGDVAAYAEWRAEVGRADIVFYLLRADRLLERDAVVESRVRNDLRHVGGWLEKRPSRPDVFIVGTHCDRDPEFRRLSPKTEGDYMDKFRRLPLVSELVARAGGAQQAKLVLGSLETVSDTEALVFKVFTQVTP